MRTNNQNPLDLFIIIAGTLLTFQLVLASSSARPIVFRDIGMLSKEAVLALILIVIAIALSIVVLSLFSLLPGLMPSIDLSRYYLLSLVVGAELAVLGLAAVSLSRCIVSGTTVPMMPIGIELFSVGMMSLALFVQNMGPSCAVKGMPNYSFLIFFISLLPAALLI